MGEKREVEQRKLPPLELKRILARHRGWLANPQDEKIPAEPLPEDDPYLARMDPVYPTWRDEALSSPERANLSVADLRVLSRLAPFVTRRAA